MSALARIPFSILDLAPIVQGRDAADAFRNTVAVAQQAERLGYNRFWLAEHHNINGVASSATAVLIGHVAAHQDAARGLGRRDAAQSRAADHRRAVRHAGNPVSRPHRPGPGPRARQRRRHAARAAARPRSGLEFPALVEELRGFLAPSRPGQPVRAIPGEGLDIPIWLLGSSDFSARMAAELGLPFSFAGHFSPEGMAAMRLYRHLFAVRHAVQALFDDRRARHRRRNGRGRALPGHHAGTEVPFLVRGNRLQLQPPVESMDGVWNEWERAAVEQRLGAAIVGGPDTVKRKLEALVAETEADEVMIVSDFFDIRDRLRSFEIVASLKNGAGLSTRTGA